MNVAHRLPASTALGPVRLRVADLPGASAFYQRVIGLRDLGDADGVTRLGVPGRTLVELLGDPGAPERPRRSTGLFHLAILVPERADLAVAVRRVADAGWSFTGAADHLVSEALYLDDPEGNGIELYRDRPRAQWTRRDGELEMATLPLDLPGVLGALPAGAADEGMPEGTVMGHVHLQVRGVDEADAFYTGRVGFDPVVRGYPGALFVSAGGYHHHLGLNTWGTRDAPPPPRGARGLERLVVELPGRGDLDALAGRVGAAPAGEGAVEFADPSGNRILARVAGAAEDY